MTYSNVIRNPHNHSTLYVYDRFQLYSMIWLALILTASQHATPRTALYYKLSLADLKAKDWPQRWSNYDILVADPGLSNASLAQIRKDLPHARIVAYTCMGWAYVRAPCTNCTGTRL